MHTAVYTLVKSPTNVLFFDCSILIGYKIGLLKMAPAIWPW